MTLEQARREMIANHEQLIETTARDLQAKTGRPLDDCRDWIRAQVLATLPPGTRLFLETGRLPNEPD